MTGAPSGVVVTWVDRDGAAKGQLMVGDVIEAVDGRKLETRQHWDVRMARLTEGETVTLRARRQGEIREVWLVASAMTPKPVDPVARAHAPGPGEGGCGSGPCRSGVRWRERPAWRWET